MVTTTHQTTCRRGIAVVVAAGLLVRGTATPHGHPRRRATGGAPATCDPAQCVTAKFQFALSWPQGDGSVYRCPADGGNAIAVAMAATFPAAASTAGVAGFGPWAAEQCVHKSYTPGPLAFAGPGPYSGQFVPACPDAVFCACGGARDQVVALLNSGGGGDPAAMERPLHSSPLFWAALAPGFALAQGFSRPPGSANEALELVYEHPDGRRQFCSAVNSMTYDFQDGAPFPRSAPAAADTLRYLPDGYTTECGWFTACGVTFAEAGSNSDGCGWWWQTRRTCVPAGLRPGGGSTRLADATEADVASAEPAQAPDSPPAWSEWGGWTACSTTCAGGGRQQKHRRCSPGTGASASTWCAGEATATRGCNEDVPCQTWTDSEFRWHPSCPDGYAHVSTAWSWWKRKYTCVQL